MKKSKGGFYFIHQEQIVGVGFRNIRVQWFQANFVINLIGKIHRVSLVCSCWLEHIRINIALSICDMLKRKPNALVWGHDSRKHAQKQRLQDFDPEKQMSAYTSDQIASSQQSFSFASQTKSSFLEIRSSKHTDACIISQNIDLKQSPGCLKVKKRRVHFTWFHFIAMITLVYFQ